MPVAWGPHFIVPSKTLTSFSGKVLLRETFDEELLRKELEELGISGDPIKATNPWYFRKNGTDTWIKIGESKNRSENFPARWDTTHIDNGQYEIMGLMHVFAKKGSEDMAIARQNIVEVTVEN